MKYINLVLFVLLYSLPTFSQIYTEAQKQETIRWLNERLKEAAPKEPKKIQTVTIYRSSNFDESMYIIRTKSYIDYQGKRIFAGNEKTTIDFSKCKQDLMMKFVDDGKLWLSVGVDANDDSITETGLDESNKVKETKRLSSIEIGPFKADRALTDKIIKAFQSLTSYCKSKPRSTGATNGDVNIQAIVDWLNNKMSLAAKLPLTVKEGEVLKQSKASLFEKCTYTVFTDTWEFTKDNIGSVGIIKQTVNMNKLDASTATLYFEDGFAWFIVMTKEQEKNIPVYRCGKDKQVISLESYVSTITIGPFADEPTTKDVAKRYITTLINRCNLATP
jgi:hypothetical protein